MILEVFIDYCFWVKIVARWLKNLCNLIIAVRFNFCANMTVRSSLNCWDQSIIVGSSHNFKSDRFDLSSIYLDILLIYPRYIPIYPDISPIYPRYIPIYLRYFTKKLN